MRTFTVYKATLTLTRVELLMNDLGDAPMYNGREANQVTLDSFEVTLGDPGTALEQVLAVGTTKLEQGVFGLGFEDKTEDAPRMTDAAEH